jgi:hypothetical protein
MAIGGRGEGLPAVVAGRGGGRTDCGVGHGASVAHRRRRAQRTRGFRVTENIPCCSPQPRSAGSVYRCGTGRGSCAARTRHTPPRGRKKRRGRAFSRFLPPWRSCVTAVGGGEQGVFCAALKRVVLSVVVERAEHFASASEYKCGVSPHLPQMPRRGRGRRPQCSGPRALPARATGKRMAERDLLSQ